MPAHLDEQPSAIAGEKSVREMLWGHFYGCSPPPGPAPADDTPAEPIRYLTREELLALREADPVYVRVRELEDERRKARELRGQRIRAENKIRREERKRQIAANRRAGAKKAAETRKRNREARETLSRLAESISARTPLREG
jgi:hypothetical protein